MEESDNVSHLDSETIRISTCDVIYEFCSTSGTIFRPVVRKYTSDGVFLCEQKLNREMWAYDSMKK